MVGVGLEAQLVLEGDSECDKKVHRRTNYPFALANVRSDKQERECLQLGKDVFFLAVGALLGVDPENPPEVLGCQYKLGPILSALHVSFVGTRIPEAQAKTDDETGDSEEGRLHADFVKACVLASK